MKTKSSGWMVGVSGLTLLTGITSAWAAERYIVKKGDTLSQISADHIGHPIYGKAGSLKKALLINPDIHNPDLIRIGDELIITDEGILIKRTATPEQVKTAETQMEKEATPARTPEPTPIEVVSEPTPEPTPEPPAKLTHGTVSLRGSLGPVISSTKQTGAFGIYDQSSTGAFSLSTNLLATFGDGRVEFAYARVSPELNGQTKQYQSFLIKGGYRFIIIGMDEMTAPIGSIITNNITFKDLTTISPLLGVHFEWGFDPEAPAEYRKSVDFEGEYAALALKDTTSSGFTTNNLSGYTFRLRGRIEKSIYSKGKFNLFLGLEGDAQYQSLKFDGTFGALSGQVERKIQIYQGLLTLNAEI